MAFTILVCATTRKGWLKGDVIVAKQPLAPWGTQETLPGFVKIHITNGNISASASLISPRKSGANVTHRRDKHLSAALVDEVVATGGEADKNLGQLNSATENHL